MIPLALLRVDKLGCVPLFRYFFLLGASASVIFIPYGTSGVRSGAILEVGMLD